LSDLTKAAYNNANIIQSRLFMVRFCWLVLLTLVLLACDNTISRSEQPVILLAMPSWQLILNDAAAPVETPLKLQLNFTGNNHKIPVAIEAELIGISMYMGKIPLKFRQQTSAKSDMQSFVAEFFLGACSDPKMQWQINISIRYSDGGVEKQSQKFYSTW
jgi:hypothetical protein